MVAPSDAGLTYLYISVIYGINYLDICLDVDMSFKETYCQ